MANKNYASILLIAYHTWVQHTIQKFFGVFHYRKKSPIYASTVRYIWIISLHSGIIQNNLQRQQYILKSYSSYKYKHAWTVLNELLCGQVKRACNTRYTPVTNGNQLLVKEHLIKNCSLWQTKHHLEPGKNNKNRN